MGDLILVGGQYYDANTENGSGGLAATTHAGCASFGMTFRTFKQCAHCHGGYGSGIVAIGAGYGMVIPRRRAATLTAARSVASDGGMWRYGYRPGRLIGMTTVTSGGQCP